MVMTSSRKRHLEYNHKQDTTQNQHINVNTSRNSIEIILSLVTQPLVDFFCVFLQTIYFIVPQKLFLSVSVS